MPFKPGFSGNPHGRPPKGKSLTEIIDRKLPKEEFAERLIGIALGKIDAPPLVAASCMRMILSYVDGLPVRKEELEKRVEVVVRYVEEPRYPDAIDITPRQVESGTGRTSD
jgi:hypothetical protein